MNNEIIIRRMLEVHNEIFIIDAIHQGVLFIRLF